jgi:hypothetical protein
VKTTVYVATAERAQLGVGVHRTQALTPATTTGARDRGMRLPLCRASVAIGKCSAPSSPPSSAASR